MMQDWLKQQNRVFSLLGDISGKRDAACSGLTSQKKIDLREADRTAKSQRKISRTEHVVFYEVIQ